MKKIIFVILIIFLSGLKIYGNDSNITQNLTKIGNLQILTLEGTPYQRGFKHGKILKKDINDLVRLWKNDLKGIYNINPEKFIQKFLKETNFKKEIIKWVPHLLDEVKGIADGCGKSFKTMFAFQLIDEMWVMGRKITNHHCTTIGFKKTKSNPVIVSQTLDIPSFYHGFQTLLHIKDKKLNIESYIFTIPGVLGTNGINNASLGVVVNAVQQLKYSNDGMPVDFIIRGLLEKKSLKEAIKFLKDIKHGAPQNYMIGDLNGVVSLECSVNTINEYIPFKGANIRYHTNHPIKNNQYTSEYVNFIKSKKLNVKTFKYQCRRLNYLKNEFKDNSVKISLKKLKNIYKDRNFGINNKGTNSCAIMILNKNPVLYISPGRPDENPFQTFFFDKK